MGWNIAADGSGTFYTADKSLNMPVNHLTLFAEWADNNSLFITSWNTANTSDGSSTSNQVSLPLEATGEYDFKVYWGDSTKAHITPWDVYNVRGMACMFDKITLSTSNYSAILNGWAALPSLQSEVEFHGGNSKYNAGAVAARNNLVNTYKWTIIDGALE